MAEECALCSAEFGSAAELLMHLRKDHGVAEPSSPPSDIVEAPADSICARCGATFPTREELAAHNLDPGPAHEPGRHPSARGDPTRRVTGA